MQTRIRVSERRRLIDLEGLAADQDRSLDVHPTAPVSKSRQAWTGSSSTSLSSSSSHRAASVTDLPSKLKSQQSLASGLKAPSLAFTPRTFSAKLLPTFKAPPPNSPKSPIAAFVPASTSPSSPVEASTDELGICDKSGDRSIPHKVDSDLGQVCVSSAHDFKCGQTHVADKFEAGEKC